jgi:hypothetical protein
MPSFTKTVGKIKYPCYIDGREKRNQSNNEMLHHKEQELPAYLLPASWPPHPSNGSL